MENFFAIFPCYGKYFSTLWKKRPELPLCSPSLTRSPPKRGAIDLAFALRLSGLGSALGYFPHNGKIFRQFSTQWKNFFHSVENR